MYRHDILDLETGQIIAWNVCDVVDAWRWITAVTQHLYGCDYAEIDTAESDDGDLLTVRGQPIGRLPVPIRVAS